MVFNLSGKIDFEDYIKFCKAYQKYGFFGRFNLVIFLVIFVLFSYMYLPDLETLTRMLKEAPIEFAKIVGPLILAIAFVILFHTKGMLGLYKKQYEVNKELQRAQNITVGKTWITISTNLGETTMLKSHIGRIIYAKDVIYIYQEKYKGYILKKQFLKDESDFNALMVFIKENYED